MAFVSFSFFTGDSLGLTPADDKELAVYALGGCIHLLKECLLEQQLLAQARFKTYTPPDFSNETLKFANNMVIINSFNYMHEIIDK